VVKIADYAGDGALQSGALRAAAAASAQTIANFEGLSNQNNFNIFGFVSIRPIEPETSVRTTTWKW
jgi:hypothetical protein